LNAVAGTGLAALAVAIGIGRFAFTPLLPAMQEDFGVTVAQGGWLASANYVGYLLGALAAVRVDLRPASAVRTGLAAIAAATIAMGLTHRFDAWMALRAVAGFASAWVLVYVSAWALEELASQGRGDLGGVVYAGVGAGIFAAGAACLALFHFRFDSSQAWIALGAAALLFAIALWNQVDPQRKRGAAAAASSAPPAIPESRRLVLCYGAFGLGYIVPATFLPVMAKQAVPDPALFGWAWPVFGAAAALSTLAAARIGGAIGQHGGQRGVWIAGNLVMAAGVLVPIALPTLAGILIAALCVGGTFMVITMAGLQEARRIAGAQARGLMAAMTSAFALGQIAGPLLVSALAGMPNGFAYALTASALPLVLAAWALAGTSRPR
jgi:predicted MFS family arabinose efflux permease